MRDTITVTPPQIKLQVCLPRLYGLRLRLVGWLMALVGVVAGDLVTVDIVNGDDAEA